MAKKSRTPPPPRRVQAPKARTGERDGRGRRPLLLLVGAAALAAAAAALALVFAFRGSPSPQEVLADAGCSLETFPGQNRRHVRELPEGFEYNSFPPTSGPHHDIPAPFDVYEEPVDQMRLVHNLEHGAVVIQYGRDVPRSDVDRLVTWYRQDPNGLVVAPLPGLGGDIALAAWVADVDERGRASNERGVLAKCPRFDEDAFDAFVEEFGFQAPERFPREQLRPGV